jgi:hypothetical protein
MMTDTLRIANSILTFLGFLGNLVGVVLAIVELLG